MMSLRFSYHHLLSFSLPPLCLPDLGTPARSQAPLPLCVHACLVRQKGRKGSLANRCSTVAKSVWRLWAGHDLLGLLISQPLSFRLPPRTWDIPPGDRHFCPTNLTRMLCISSTLMSTCSTTVPYSIPVGTFLPPRSCCRA